MKIIRLHGSGKDTRSYEGDFVVFSPIVHVIWASFLLKHSFYEVLNAFVHFFFFLWWCVIYHLLVQKGKFSKQGHHSSYLPFDFYTSFLLWCNADIYFFFYEICAFKGKVYSFFKFTSVKVYSHKRCIFAINVKYNFKVIILWCLLCVSVLLVNSIVNYPGLHHLFPQRHTHKKKTKTPKQNGEESQCR